MAVEWNLQRLHYGVCPEDEVPDVETTKRLLKDYHDLWCMRDVTPYKLSGRIYAILELHEECTDMSWRFLQHRMKRDWMRWRKLYAFAKYLKIDGDGEVRDLLINAHRYYQTAARYLVLNNMMCMHMRNDFTAPNREPLLPTLEELKNGELDLKFELSATTLADTNEANLKPFQESFFKLCDVLAGEDYRRAGVYFLSRCVTASNLETQAFERAIKIVDFVDENTRYDSNLDAWLVHTSDGAVHHRIVEYFTERPIAEAPDIEENCHLRSYEGDAYGRGAVIYDCATDMAWPYATKAEWSRIEERVNAIRKCVHGEDGEDAFDRKRHGVVAPAPEDVCVVHLQASFPYDTFTETQELVADDNPECFLQRAWYDAEHFECCHERYRLNSYRLVAYMQRTFSPEEADEPAVWGRSWQRACAPLGREMRELRTRGARTVREMTSSANYPLSDAFIRDNVLDETIEEHHYVVTASGEKWVPLCTPARKRRYRLDMATWTALGLEETCVPRRTFVRLRPYAGQRWTEVAAAPDGFRALAVPDVVERLLLANRYEGESCLPEDLAATLQLTETTYVRARDVLFVPVPAVAADAATRYLRVHTGRTWRDCATPHFDKIYDSQAFTTNDKYMLWGQKGRTLFTVHEFDTYQITFIIVGYGGTGKSTIMTVMQRFWPAHLRGILSSNIEQKFGMSQVLNEGRSRAIFCNEVSEDLQLVQEDWQTSCSGEEGSYAVKNKDAWVGVCKAHQFWCGNGFPRHWKNNNNQVSRRLCGVLMANPIQPRDGGVMNAIERNMGAVQRKMVLAYFDMIEQYGTTDPMSRPDRLPPAFGHFYSYGRGLSNPVETFIDENIDVKFEIHIGPHPRWNNKPLVMPTSTFRDLYMAWRSTRNDLSKIPHVSADKYLPPLRERGVVEHQRATIVDSNGMTTITNILVGIGECDVPPPTYVVTAQ